MKRFFCLLLAIALLPICLHAEFREITSLSEMAAELECAGSDTLVLFDVDQVLLVPKNPVFHIYNIRAHRGAVQSIFASLTPDEQSTLINLTWAAEELGLVEEMAPALVCDLQGRGLRVMGLTGSGTASLPGIGCLKRVRVESLADFGMDFSGAFPSLDSMVFDDMQELLGSYPAYQDGVLFCNGPRTNTKGDVLLRFFEEVEWRPSTVVFVDDAQANLQSVEEALASLGIPCLCFLYKGVEQHHYEPVSFEAFQASWRPYVLEAKASSLSEL